LARFLTTSGISYEMENLLKDVKRKIYLVSPYLKFSQTFYERLKDIDKRAIYIYLVFGKNDLQKDQEEMLSTIKNLNLYYSNNLHAKCYYNESNMIIGSMNLYEFSEKNNREMALLINIENDREAFMKATEEVDSIINASERIVLKRRQERNSYIVREVSQKQSKGYCIRCGEPKQINPSEPYCRECYSIWAEYGNRFYIENRCHICGEDAETTIDKPLCYSCYKEMSF